MKISALAVWYNPDISAVENVLSYSALVEKVYIIDNSDSDNSHLAEKIPNSSYTPNFSNIGIAGALNAGCRNAMDDGFEWIMTMDQDSSWKASGLSRLLLDVENSSDPAIKSFAPVHRNGIKSVAGRLIQKIEKKPSERYVFQDRVMASGNVISLSAWEKVGKFNEPLFIDEVDHEFCYRLIKNGYKIRESQEIEMTHTLGSVKKTLLPRPCKHSGVRLFYIFRNMNYIRNNFPDMFKKHGYKKYMTLAFLQKTLELKFGDLSYISKGISACRKGIFGPYEEYEKKEGLK